MPGYYDIIDMSFMFLVYVGGIFILSAIFTLIFLLLWKD